VSAMFQQVSAGEAGRGRKIARVFPKQKPQSGPAGPVICKVNLILVSHQRITHGLWPGRKQSYPPAGKLTGGVER